MKKHFFKTTSLLIVFVLLVSGNAFALDLPDITSKGACVIDFDTGEILFGRNENNQMVPASMTKLVTVYCVYDAIRNNKISLTDYVPISKELEKNALSGYYANYLPLYTNGKYTVDELLDASLIYSSSGAVVALSEYVGGNVSQFVGIMNDTLKRLDIEGVFYDSHGVSASNRISPYNMVKFVRRLIIDYPQVIERTSKKVLNFHGAVYESTNKLLGKYYYEGADGMKTGTTSAAGYCFCATAKRGEKRLVSVTMFSASNDERFTDSIKILDYGFDKAKENNSGIFYTDIEVFFDNIQIPAYYYKSGEHFALIKAEDMANCGFDVNFSERDRTLYINCNSEKERVSSANPDMKPGLKYSGISQSDIKVVLMINDEMHMIKNAFNSNGYMMISIDELAEYFPYSWNTETKKASFEAFFV